jgi:hypothetical protein
MKIGFLNIAAIITINPTKIDTPITLPPGVSSGAARFSRLGN